MAILINSHAAEKARDIIVSRLLENQKKPVNERKIRTWEISGSSTKTYRLNYTGSSQWKDCGSFGLAITDENQPLKLGLHVAKEHYKKGDKWPDLIATLHGDLIQLLLNHFPEFVSLKGPGLTVVNSYYLIQELEKK